jgi:septum formation protein
MRLWLASASPRRKQILEAAGFEVVAVAAHIDESWSRDPRPRVHALLLAAEKARSAPANEPLVVAADTVVHLDDVLYEKPRDEEDARRILRRLSGAWHEVSTGIAVRKGPDTTSFTVNTAVRFRTLSDDEIDRYIATGEPMDKAGAYGIQGLGGMLVAELNGSWTNVMGLPLEQTLEVIRAPLDPP